ncbi:hypothetical protein [Oscillatoria sp. HE19RPO]|uniref:hypothetical protein n=1 Tax=Oscillatoria sp. HE19RPO TaxID=2954806 RepID=UPI0020C41E09|nr:hypothetical protein [Oscillatoria sp. HE19RPO]
MLMIPFIVQNLSAIGQSDDGLIDPLAISMLLAGLQAIGDRNFKTRYPTGWVACFGRLCPYSLTLSYGMLREQGVGFYRLSPFRIQVQLSRIDLLVAPWFPPSLWTRGIFMRFPSPQPGQQGPPPSFSIALYLPKNTPMKPRPSGSSRSEWRFQPAIFAHFPCIKLRSAVPDPATKPTENYGFFSFFQEKLRRSRKVFER